MRSMTDRTAWYTIQKAVIAILIMISFCAGLGMAVGSCVRGYQIAVGSGR